MKNIGYKKGIVFGIIILFLGIGIQPAFAININPPSNIFTDIDDKSLIDIYAIQKDKKLLTSKIHSEMPPSTGTVYTGAFILGRIKGEIDYWENLEDSYVRYWPIDVTIRGIYFSEKLPFYITFFSFDIPPNYGWDWRFVTRRFFGELTDNYIDGYGFFIGIVGFGE